jgi:hypothetical protein
MLLSGILLAVFIEVCNAQTIWDVVRTLISLRLEKYLHFCDSGRLVRFLSRPESSI